MSDPKYKILCVDDDPLNLKLLEVNLLPEGYEVLKAADGHSAIQMVKTVKPHVVLLDIMMPGIGGIDTLKEIKKIDPHVGVIMVTAMADEEIANRTLELGAHDYITKPIDFDYLKKALIKEAIPLKDHEAVRRGERKINIRLRTVTQESERALRGKEFEITRMPFRIGRADNRTLVEFRDLSLVDQEPFQISRDHCYITCIEGQYYFVDAKSTLGTTVDGERIGKHGNKRSVQLGKGAHKIILGNPGSRYVFELEILD